MIHKPYPQIFYKKYNTSALFPDLEIQFCLIDLLHRSSLWGLEYRNSRRQDWSVLLFKQTPKGVARDVMSLFYPP